MAGQLSYASRAAAAAPLRQTSAVSPRSKCPNSTHIRVPAATPGQTYRNPDVLYKDLEERKRLDFGSQVFVYFDLPGGEPIRYIPENNRDQIKACLAKYKPRTIALDGLCAVSAVIEEAVDSNCAKEYRNVVEHLCLPEGDPAAYVVVIEWLDHLTVTSEIKPIQAIYETPLWMYYHILQNAKNLHITPLIQNIGNRFNKMIKYHVGANWNVDPNDIRLAYQKLSGTHPLCVALLNSVAMAWQTRGLSGKKFDDIKKVMEEYSEFLNDLKLKVDQLAAEVFEVVRKK